MLDTNKITTENARQLYALRTEHNWSWYELASRYCINEVEAREAFAVIKAGGEIAEATEEPERITVPADWCYQHDEDGTRALLKAVTGRECVPCEGGVGVAGHGSVSYYDAEDGKGYTLVYEFELVGEDEAEVEWGISPDHRWDRPEPTTFPGITEAVEYVEAALGEYVADYDTEAIAREVTERQGDRLVLTVDEDGFWDVAASHDRAVPAVTFATAEEYEAQCERCTEAGIQRAAELVWKEAKRDAEAHWRREEDMRDKGLNPGMAIANAKAMLAAYGSAMRALGYRFEVTVDHIDAHNRIFQVSSPFGCVRSYAKPDW